MSVFQMATRLGELGSLAEQKWPILLGTLAVVLVTTRLLSAATGAPKPAGSSGAKTPPMVPYWVPFLGHIPQMLFGYRSFVDSVRRAHARGVVSINLLGTTHTVIFRPSLALKLMAKPHALADAESIGRRLMVTNFGYPRDKMETYHEMMPDLVAEYRHLLSEPSLGLMVDTTVEAVRAAAADFVTFNRSPVDQAAWERMAAAEVVEVGGAGAGATPGEKVVEANLFELTRNFVAQTANPSLMGTDFVANFPDFWDELWALDRGFGLLALDLPRWLPVPGLARARAGLRGVMARLTAFHEAMERRARGEDPGAHWSDLDNVSPMLRARTECHRRHGLTMEERAACETALAWAMNANANPLVSWLLARLYGDEDLLARVRAEVAPFVRATQPAAGGFGLEEPPRLEAVDVDGLAARCPLLKAAYIESLRIDVSSWSLKVVREDFELSERGGDAFALRKGTYAHAAHELHHTDPAAFEDPDEWRVERHIRLGEVDGVEGKVPVADMGTVRPYGGGVSMCKGRAFALKEILLYTAVILTMYDMEPAGGEPWRLPKQARSAGTKQVGEDFRVWIRRRMPPQSKE